MIRPEMSSRRAAAATETARTAAQRTAKFSSGIQECNGNGDLVNGLWTR